MTQKRATGVRADAPLLPTRRFDGTWIRWAVVFVSCVLATNALIGERGFAESLRAREQLRRTAAELERLKRENRTLHDQAQRLVSDRRTIEDVARAELGLIRKGEVLVLLKTIPPARPTRFDSLAKAR